MILIVILIIVIVGIIINSTIALRTSCSCSQFKRYSVLYHQLKQYDASSSSSSSITSSSSSSSITSSSSSSSSSTSTTTERKFFIETHGCQMNLADSDVVRSVLLTAGYSLCDTLEDADLILTNTCAIRENAESKIWQRIKYFNSLKKKARKEGRTDGSPLIGILGCMAERLKDELLDEKGVDFIAGPDSYRDLPNLLLAASPNTETNDIQKVANVQLSMEETYADISPVRLDEGNTHAFVTITRGCNNHCAFCIGIYYYY